MIKKRFFLILLSLSLSLFLTEIILGKYFPQKTYSSLYQNSIDCFSSSDKTVFTLKPNCIINFTDYETKENFTAKTNSLGYRGEDFFLQKQPGEKRVFLAGDSFILGYGVRDEEVVSTILSEKLKNLAGNYSLSKAQVINAGYTGGFGPDGYYLQLKNQGIKLLPDLVVFSVFVYNDLSDMENDEWIGIGEFGEPQKIVSRTTIVDNGHLLPMPTPFVYRIPFLRDSQTAIFILNTSSAFRAFVKYNIDRVYFKIRPPMFDSGQARDSNLPGPYTSFCIFNGNCHRRIIHLFSDLMSTIKASKKLVDESNADKKIHFVALLIPVDFQIYPEAMSKYESVGIPLGIADENDPQPQKRIKEMLEKEKIPYIDLLPVFKKSKEKLYFKEDGHWNKLGHQAAAEAIYQWIKNNNW